MGGLGGVEAVAWLGETARGERRLFGDHAEALRWTRGNVPCRLTPLYPHRPAVIPDELARLRAERSAPAAALARQAGAFPEGSPI